MNTFDNIPAFPTADMRAVVRPNFDTLYSSGWVDLTREPMVISVPDTGGRYYLLPMLDMWTDVFASPGWRTTGTKAGNFLARPAGVEWKRYRPGFIAHRCADALCVDHRPHQDGWPVRTMMRSTRSRRALRSRLCRLGQSRRVASKAKIDPSVDMKTPPKMQVDTMPADKYFTYAAELLKLHPPHITDEPIIARMKRIGIEPGKSFDFAKLEPAVKKAIEDAPAAGQKLMEWKVPTLGPRREQLVDEYRHDGCLRELLSETRHRCATGPRRESSRGCDLSAQSCATKPASRSMARTNTPFTSTKTTTPPVNAFWSITLYDPEGFQVAN